MKFLSFPTVYSFFLVVWLALFGTLLWRTNRSAIKLKQATEKIEMVSAHLIGNSQKIIELIDQTKAQSNELSLLQNIFNFLPQKESYLRTQKAILDEVQALRTKMGKRLKGRLHILIDTKANKLYLKEGVKLMWEADCSVGRGGIFSDKKTGRRWEFVTPRGKFKILGKMENPVWTKPDWAFVETGESVPPPDDPKRNMPGELGAYVFILGDGYLIHGTKSEDLLGRPASHGCVRLGADNLKKLFEIAPVGTEVYIY